MKDIEKAFWPCVWALLCLMGALQVLSALQESQTYDEAVHLVAGYSYLRTGDYRVNREHPPLGKMIAALPLLAFGLDLDTTSKAWRLPDSMTLGADFLYRNRVPADIILFWGRAGMILVTLCLGLAIAIWCRRRFGAAPALGALFLFVLDPNFIAHGHYVTNDVLLSLTVFLAVIAWNAYLTTWRISRLVLASLAVAAALLSKFTGLFLAPVFLVLFGIRWWQERGSAWQWLKRLALAVVVIPAIAILATGAIYAKETWRLTFDKSAYVSLLERVDRGTMPIRLIRSAGRILHLPAYSYLVGLADVARHTADGHDSYVLGRRSQTGAWYYFPVAFAVKTPTTVLGLLLAAVAGAALVLSRLSPREWTKRLRQARLEWFVLAIPACSYFLLATYTRLNIGMRHILPVYPFLFILIAATLQCLRTRVGKTLPILVCAAAVAHATETLRVHPHYIAFFNSISGGPARGPDYLVDSNLSWGQELIQIKQWHLAQGEPPLCLAYFGSAIPDMFNIPWTDVPANWDTHGRASADCIVAISATLLKDVYVQPGRYAWLRRIQPSGRIGYSVYLYDLRKR